MNTTPWPEGIKDQTAEAIWSVLTTADKPMTAIGIAEKLGDSDTHVDVYHLPHPRITRNKGESLPVQPSWVAIWLYYEITPHTHRHYAVCTSCGTMVPLHTLPCCRDAQRAPD